MADEKKEKLEAKKTGFVILEFTKNWATKKKGDQETYHVSTADTLVNQKKVAKVVKELEKYVPKEAKK